MKAQKLPLLTIQEYSNLELESGKKYEYHDGAITALAGGTLNHGKLCGTIYAELRMRLKEKKSSCSAFSSEIKLFIEGKNAFVYPDAHVVCGEVESNSQFNAIKNPTLIVEVLSTTTADYDRGEKFYFYRTIQSLQEYVLIEQDRAVVEVFYKQTGSELWRISRFEGLSETAVFQSIEVELPLSILYEDITDIG